jgi:hypothetical protein
MAVFPAHRTVITSEAADEEASALSIDLGLDKCLNEDYHCTNNI